MLHTPKNFIKDSDEETLDYNSLVQKLRKFEIAFVQKNGREKIINKYQLHKVF